VREATLREKYHRRKAGAIARQLRAALGRWRLHRIGPNG